jgi:RHH-type proline utilization regulon transcriptional repressor/proline dehydrogenase/delta 1-pyrroline-5-carboxylate dehydrogenase
LAAWSEALAHSAERRWHAAPLLATDTAPGAAEPVRNPADAADVVGTVQEASLDDVQLALAAARQAAPSWAATAPAERAACLDAAADRLQHDSLQLCALLVREAGKTFGNAVSELREAVDFLRYSAAEVRHDFDNRTHRPLGPVVCISPWNFPLAIFTGQVAAALAAGNAVLAKPAEQTPLVAAAAVQALHAAGVPRAALQLLPGRGETVGAALVGDVRVQGVLFTGSTDVARLLQRSLSSRLTEHGQPVPLIAETGGQNCMLVDSSALAEQVVQDIVISAFDSAGQRCSALRVLCVQRDAAARVVEMLVGAMHELQLGDPRRLAVDVGPVIDNEARTGIERHIASMRAGGRQVQQAAHDADSRTAEGRGCFVPPTLIQIDSLAELEREVFGPVLHVLRYERDQLPTLLRHINATGYGLTCGVHTRIDETVVQVAQAVRAGNLYVNRNVVGAVVGVQPFGGEGLSGTGPKAGGPLYLLRLLAERPGCAARAAVLRAGVAAAAPVRGFALHPREADVASALRTLQGWAGSHGLGDLAKACENAFAQSPVVAWRSLPGPTGEANLYAVLPRDAVLCLAPADAAGDAVRLVQLAAVLAVGGRALWPSHAQSLWERLPAEVRERVALAQDWTGETVHFEAVLHAGTSDSLRGVLQQLAARRGPIVGVTQIAAAAGEVPLERLVIERALSINTAAAGGNASLMTIG